MGPLERAVMQQLWAADVPQSVRDVQEHIATERTIAYTTVMTVMDNLHTKGFVTRQSQGRAYVYRASETREEHTAAMLGDVLADGGDRRGVLMHFIGGLDAEELESLRRIVNDPSHSRPGAK